MGSGLCGSTASEDPHGDGKSSLPWWPNESQAKLAAQTGLKGSCTAKLLVNQQAIFSKMIFMKDEGNKEDNWRDDIKVLPYPPDDKSRCIANEEGRMGSRESKILVNQGSLLSMLCGDDLKALPYQPSGDAYKYANIHTSHGLQKGSRESRIWVNQAAVFNRLKGYAVEELPLPVNSDIESLAADRRTSGTEADNTILTCQLAVNQEAIFKKLPELAMVKGQAKLRAVEAGLQGETSPQREEVPKVQCKHCGAEQEHAVKCRVCSVLLDTHTKAETTDATRKFFADRTKENKQRSRRQSVERRNSSSAMKVANSMAQEVRYARRQSIS